MNIFPKVISVSKQDPVCNKKNPQRRDPAAGFIIVLVIAAFLFESVQKFFLLRRSQ